eukprot:2081-Ditylum_brightwellii.AAC.1
MEVLLLLCLDAYTFWGNEGGNLDGDIHRKVVTPDELPPLIAGSHCFLCWGANEKMIQLGVLSVLVVKMGVILF